MRISAAALSSLILAAALGSLAYGYRIHESLDNELRLSVHQIDFGQGHTQGLHRPAECCFSYTPRKIRCAFMESYFPTTSRCSQPAVIFITKGQQRVCTNPEDKEVQHCMMNLNRVLDKKLETWLKKNRKWGLMHAVD